jgi:hypothetical protein
MGYTVFSIEQMVCIDHCKNFVGQGVPMPSTGKFRETLHTQSAADAQQRWFW